MGRPRSASRTLRLAIIDLREINDQPLIGALGRLALSFNGEIYNYVELRDELEGLGHEFRTSGDTEVLLAAYAEVGPACVERLVGMWAFSILDARRAVLLSRDRFGVKPLYWTLRDGRAPLRLGDQGAAGGSRVAPEPNEEVVRRYLLTGGVDESERRPSSRGVYSCPRRTTPLSARRRPSSAGGPSATGRSPRGATTAAVAEAAGEFRRAVDRFGAGSRAQRRSGRHLPQRRPRLLGDRLRGRRAAPRDQIPHYAHSGFGYVPERGGASPSGRTWRRSRSDRAADDLRRGPCPSASAPRWSRSPGSRTSRSDRPASRRSGSSSTALTGPASR